MVHIDDDNGSDGGKVVKKQESYKTAFNVANTMVGTAIPVLPLTFAVSGVFSSIAVVVFVGLISYKTCDLLVVHFRRNDNDVVDAVNRVLGRKWGVVFNASSVFLLFFVNIIFFLLVVNIMYGSAQGFLEGIFDWKPEDFKSKDDFVLNQFSFQWMGIILIIMTLFTIQFGDVSKFIKLNALGFYAIAAFSIFILYCGARSIFTQEFTLDQAKAVKGEVFYVNLFTSDIVTLCGIFALAFMVHNAVYALIKHNAAFEKNSRDVGVGYILAGILYIVVGVLGYFGTFCGKDDDFCKEPATKAKTVMDYYDQKRVVIMAIQVVYGFHIFTVIPIVAYVCRTQLLTLVMGNPEPKGIYTPVVNVIICIACLVPTLLNVGPTLVIAFAGAVCGFLLLWIIPIAIHWKMLYGGDEENSRGLLDQQAISMQPGAHPDSTNNESTLTKVIDDAMSPQGVKEEEDEDNRSLFERDIEKERAFPKWIRATGFSLLIIYGLATMGLQIYQIIDGIAGGGH